MDAQTCSKTVEIIDTGVKSPLYSDRQVVRASDLSLDRESHEAALMRMRRLLHGWGIVNGFDLIQDEQGQKIIIGEGYGVSPSGQEVFLPEAIEINDLVPSIREACGKEDPGCEMISEETMATALAVAAAENAGLGAWLIARPVARATSPRPGVPQGCDALGNAMLNTRLCQQVQFELLCGLPSDKIYAVPSCADLDAYICSGEKIGVRQSLPAETPIAPGSAGDYIVLGYLQLVDLRVEPMPWNRRPLLPTQVMQHWLMACLCTIVHAPDDPVVDEDPTPDTGNNDTGNNDTGNGAPRPGIVTWADIIQDYGNRFPGEYVFELEPQRDLEDLLNDGHTDPVPDFMRLLGQARIEKMQLDGILGPADFLAADLGALAAATGLDTRMLLQFKQGFLTYQTEWSGIGAASGDVAGPRFGESWAEFEGNVAAKGMRTNWTEAGAGTSAGATSGARPVSLTTEPILTAMTSSSADLAAKGYSGPVDVIMASNETLAADLGVSPQEAAVVKTDLMRFAGMMGGVIK